MTDSENNNPIDNTEFVDNVESAISHAEVLLETETTSSTPPLTDLRQALLEVDELISDPEYQELAANNRENLQSVRKELKLQIQKIENPEKFLDTTSPTNKPHQERRTNTTTLFLIPLFQAPQQTGFSSLSTSSVFHPIKNFTPGCGLRNW